MHGRANCQTVTAKLQRVDKLASSAMVGFTQLIAVLAILLFAPAGSLDYWQAWLYWFVFSGSSALITLSLWKYDRMLLQRRIHAGPGAENEKNQKLIQFLASFAFVGLLVLPSFDHRYSWSAVPPPLVVLGDLLTALGFLMIFRVFKENTFTAATIAVLPGQAVVSTGPYAIVRHPMYSGALVMLLGTPLALGSWWGLLMWIPMVLIIAWRACAEEKVLVERLSGYKQYCETVHHRLVPYVW
jgi:protein-S-isoprenylcysteine O-methyltransferase Ste14